MVMFVLLIGLIRWIWHVVRDNKHHANKTLRFKAKQQMAEQRPFNRSFKIQPKPEWVVHEVLRLKALLPDHGCRKIATTFNRIHVEKSGMTVSKSYCANQIKKHQYDIQVLRRQIKHKKPKPIANNIIWAMDLTTVTASDKNQHKVFGIIDHGSRSCLSLQHLSTVTSLTLLQILLNTIKLYGKPKSIRTDNERIFTSKLFRLFLLLLGIKHQRTMVCCPWQNGRIERFFGTFKQKMNQVMVDSAEQLSCALPEYRFWYNHIRTHDHLNGYTPAEIWDKSCAKFSNEPEFFQQWNGVLSGYYFRP